MLAGVLNDIDAFYLAIIYTNVFVQESGRGCVEAAAFETLKAIMGLALMHPWLIHSLCWAVLWWGKTTGKSINAAHDILVLVSRHFSDFTTLDVVLLWDIIDQSFLSLAY
jgi:hypothetical protein